MVSRHTANVLSADARLGSIPRLSAKLVSKKVRVPDVHWGIGATVGSVIPTKGAIIPAAVGVDIGCGMMAVQTSLNARNLPDIQLQPNLAGSNFTLLSRVLSFNRQNQFASRPRAFKSHWIPAATRLVDCPISIRLRTASAVVQQPSGSSPVKAGQLPSSF